VNRVILPAAFVVTMKSVELTNAIDVEIEIPELTSVSSLSVGSRSVGTCCA
jgi:hypothetical protein